MRHLTRTQVSALVHVADGLGLTAAWRARCLGAPNLRHCGVRPEYEEACGTGLRAGGAAVHTDAQYCIFRFTRSIHATVRTEKEDCVGT